MSGWHIAQLNVGRILAPTDSPQLAEFMAALDEINARGRKPRRASSGDCNPTAVTPPIYGSPQTRVFW
jgi:hypothetical protein